jgi:pyruvate dehydrogenase E2 component (dihydrolipoamide acetyltransferase)
MSEAITMPALSDTMNTGRLVKWLKKPGDAIKKGETIAEIETDKAVMEVEAYHDGYLAAPLAPEGAEMPVGKIIGYITDSPSKTSGEPAAAVAQATFAAAKNAPPEIVRAAEVPAKVGVHPKAIAAALDKDPPAAKPAAPPFETTQACSPSAVPSAQVEQEAGTQYEPSRQTTSIQRGEEARGASISAKSSFSPPVGELSMPKALDEGVRTSYASWIASSPLARRLAEEFGVDLSRILGSGPHGRIVAADVEEAKSRKGVMATVVTEGAQRAVHGMSD